MEPLEQVVSRLVRRPRIQPWEQNALIGDSGLRAQAMADAGQGADITEAAPNTRLRARRGEMPEQQAEQPEPPAAQAVLASAKEGRNPFSFASGSNAPQGNSSQGQAPPGYRRVCDGQNCYLVPIEDGQAVVNRGLPPGVVLNPGETLVEDSFREVTTSAPQATTQPMAPAMPQPGGAQVAAPQPTPEQQSFEAAKAMHPSFAASLELLRRADADLLPPGQRYALFKQAQFHTSVGLMAVKLKTLEDLRAERRALEARADRLAGERNAVEKYKADAHVKSEQIDAGYTDMDALQKILEGPDDPRTKAKLWTNAYMNSHPRLGFDEKQAAELFDSRFGSLTAKEAGDRIEALVAAENARLDPKGSKDLAARQAMMKRQLQTVLFDRYGDIASPRERVIKMGGELRPVLQDRMFKIHVAAGKSEEEASALAIADADRWVNIAIGGVEKMRLDGRTTQPSLPLGKALPPSPAPVTDKQRATQAWGGVLTEDKE